MPHGPVPVPIVLHGQLARGARSAAMAALEALAPDAPRCLVATGRLVGEGFDHSALDTLMFAIPIAWCGTLAQYVGRLARPAPGKTDARVIDVHDTGHPILESDVAKACPRLPDARMARGGGTAALLGSRVRSGGGWPRVIVEEV